MYNTRNVEIAWDNGVRMRFENAQSAAEHLGISRQHLYRIMYSRGGYMITKRCTVRYVETENENNKPVEGNISREKLNAMPNMLEVVLQQMSGDKRAVARAWGSSGHSKVEKIDLGYKLADGKPQEFIKVLKEV